MSHNNPLNLNHLEYILFSVVKTQTDKLTLSCGRNQTSAKYTFLLSDNPFLLIEIHYRINLSTIDITRFNFK